MSTGNLKEATSEGTKILILNPDPDFSHVLMENLRIIPGYLPTCVGSHEDALQRIKTEKFDVVLSDLNLKSTTGLEFVFDVRKEFISTPEIIILSSDPMLSLHEVHQVGACHIVRKPVNMEELCAAINRAGMIGAEKRRYDRVFINHATMGRLFGQVSMVGKKSSCDVEISNIGRGGFFFKAVDDDHLPAIGQVIDFNLKLAMVPDCSFNGRGIIRWVRKNGTDIGAGVEFLSLPEDIERLVIAFADLFKVRPFVPDN